MGKPANTLSLSAKTAKKPTLLIAKAVRSLYLYLRRLASRSNNRKYKDLIGKSKQKSKRYRVNATASY